MGTLYIVSTPIGNLKDITLRAIEVLSTVDYIACEDTRRTGQLLSVILETRRVDRISQKDPIALLQGDKGRKPNLLSYYEQNELQRIPEIVNILQNGSDVALVSDAGTPTISDPGFKLVRECIAHDIKIESIPGPSSVITALTISGLPTDKFLFLGYPPKKEGHRKKLFSDIKELTIKATVILFEGPHRLEKTLEELQVVLGDIDIVVCRELTKMHEEVRREKITQSIDHFKKVPPKGEFVILFHLDYNKY